MEKKGEKGKGVRGGWRKGRKKEERLDEMYGEERRDSGRKEEVSRHTDRGKELKCKRPILKTFSR